MSNQERKNTYTDDEYFKLAVVSTSEQDAINGSIWLTNFKGKLIREDLIRAPFKNTSIVCYPRFNGDIKNIETKAFEGVVIFIEDAEKFDEITSLVNSQFEKNNVRLVISDNSQGEEWARKLRAHFHSKNDREKVLDTLDSLDQDEYYNILKMFKEIDNDNSGFINTNEMPKMVESLGESPKIEELKQAILAFDTNQDGKISLDEFIVWWKIGRKDPFAFSKFFDLEKYVKAKLFSIVNKQRVELSMKNEEINNSTKTCKTDVKLETKDLEEYASRINVRLAIGGEARSEACKNYLSRYNDKMDFNRDYFIDVAFFIKSCTIKGVSAKDYIESFKDDLIDQIDRTLVPGLKSFLGNFIVAKVFNQEHSVNVRFEFKYDIQEILKSSLNQYSLISNWLTNNGKNPLNFDLRYFSGKNLNDLLSEESTLRHLLEKCELFVKFQVLKDKFKVITENLNSDYQEFVKLISPFTNSTVFKMTYEGVANTYTDSKSVDVLETKTNKLKESLDYLRSLIPRELKDVMSRMEIGVNIVDTFASVQVFSESNWNN